jgi:hypothetical protein
MMNAKDRMRAIKLGAAVLVAAGALASAAGAADASEVIYNSIPSPLPGNFSSLGYQAYATSEFGGEVEFAGSSRNDLTVKAVMSSWACERGNWIEETCESGVRKMKNYFKVPVTFSIYEVGPGNTVGAKLWERTKAIKMQYRPSSSPKCTGGRWYDEEDATCYHGKAFVISLSGMKVRHLPAKAIVSISYNTTTHGADPIGEEACYKTSAGCPYDSLNVALSEPAEHTLSLGSDPTEDLFVNSAYPEMFCESGTEGTFGPASCPAFWEGGQPMFEITAN